MAGEARSQAFMLATATVMLGQPADLFNMTPATHSIGLVKNFNLGADASFTELTQGIRNQVVFSVKTGNKIMATMEAYEYTAKNLSYALGLEGYSAGSEIATSTTLTIPTSTSQFSVLSATGLAVGNYITIQTGNQDNVLVRKIQTLVGNVITIDVALPALPVVGATIKKCNVVPIGSDKEDVILSAYVVGTIADGTEVALALPKVKVTKGFNMAFNSNDFQNLPLELTVYDQIPSDLHYARFAAMGNASAALFTSK